MKSDALKEKGKESLKGGDRNAIQCDLTRFYPKNQLIINSLWTNIFLSFVKSPALYAYQLQDKPEDILKISLMFGYPHFFELKIRCS